MLNVVRINATRVCAQAGPAPLLDVPYNVHGLWIRIKGFFRAALSEPRDRVTGFTLVETFVAIFILTFAIGGPIAIAQKGLSSAFLSRDRITASFLAMDAIEYVRAIRDSNFLVGIAGATPDDWLVGLGDCIGVAAKCRVDTFFPTNHASAVEPCLTDEDCQLWQGTVGNEMGRYGHTTGGTWSRTNFNRTVNIITPIGDATTYLQHEARVTVTVSWKSGIHDRKILVQDHLFMWQ